LVNQKRLRIHSTSTEEIDKLLAKAERDLSDAQVPAMSLDGRFMAAYGAALSLATAALAAAGYRCSGQAHHVTVFETMPLTMGEDLRASSHYFDACRQKRNHALYDEAGLATEGDVEDIIDSAQTLDAQVRGWLSEIHPELYTGA